MTDEKRHLLVIATQCDEMQHLERLDDAAARLCETLLDPAVGHCVPALRGGVALLGGRQGTDRIGQTAIESAIREAADRARDERATLVLALLGHGFIAGESPTLYFMGADAKDQRRRSAVNVNRMLTEVIDDDDEPGLNGLIAIIDTCAAADGIPVGYELSSGARRGRLRLGLLAASGAAQDAYDLRFSRSLADVLRAGIRSHSPFVGIQDVGEELDRRLPGQLVTFFDYGGGLSATSPLWLAHNRGARSRERQAADGGTGRARAERPDDHAYRSLCTGYLKWATSEWRYIDLGDLGMESGIGPAVRIQRLPLHEMYVSLQVDPRSVADRRREEQVRRMDEADRIAAAAQSLSFHDAVDAIISQAPQDTDRTGRDPADATDAADRDGLTPEAAFARHRVLVILGHPGSGKSVMCQWLGIHLAWQELEKLGAGAPSSRIPIRFRAADYAKFYAERFYEGEQPGGLSEFLAQGLARDVGYPPRRLEGMFDRALDDGQAVLLIDGLDEVTECRNEVIDALAALVDTYITGDEAGASQAVITSRVDGYSDIYLADGEAAHYLIRPMSDGQVTKFVTRFFAAIEAPGEAPLFLGHLKDRDNAAARRLAGIPLALTSMCSYWHRHNKAFPPNEAALYRRLIVDTSFWWRNFADQDHSLFLDRLVADEADFLAMLSRVAVRIHEEHVDGQLTEAELLDTLDSALYGPARLTGADTRAEGRRLIARIQEKVGVLAEFSPGKFRFLHQVYREYLVGYDLLNRPTGANRHDKPSDEAVFLRLKDRIGDPRWREPVLLALGECGAVTRTTLIGLAIGSPDLDLEEWVDVFLTAALERPPAEANDQELIKLIEFITVAYTAIRDLPEVLTDQDVRMAGLRAHVGPVYFDSLALRLFAENEAAAAPIAALYWRRGWLTANVLAAFVASAHRDSGLWDWPVQRALRRVGAPPPLREAALQRRLERPQPDDPDLGPTALRLFELGRLPWEQERQRVAEAVIVEPTADVFPVRQWFLEHPDWWGKCLSNPESLRVLCALFGGLDHRDSLRWIAEDEDLACLVRLPQNLRSTEIERRAAELVPRFGAKEIVTALAVAVDTGVGRVSATTPEPLIDLGWMTRPGVPSVRSAVRDWLGRVPGDSVVLGEELARAAASADEPAERAEAELGLLVLDGRPMTADTASVHALSRVLEATGDAMIRGHKAWFDAVWSTQTTATDAERAALHRFLLTLVFQVAGRPIALARPFIDPEGDLPVRHPELIADDIARQVLARSWGNSQPADLGVAAMEPGRLLTVLGWLTTLPYESLARQPGDSSAALWHESIGFSPTAMTGLMPALSSVVTWIYRRAPQLQPQISAAVQAALLAVEPAEAPSLPSGAPAPEMPPPQPRSARRSRQQEVDLPLLDRLRDLGRAEPGARTELACLLMMLSLRAPEQEQAQWQAAALEFLAREASQDCLAETLSRFRGHLCDDRDVRERVRALLDRVDSPVLRAEAAGDLGRTAEILLELAGAQVSQAAGVSLLTTARVIHELSRVQSHTRDVAAGGKAGHGGELADELEREPALTEPWFLLLDREFLARMTEVLASDPAADETLTQLLPMVARIDDEVIGDLRALLAAAPPGASWAAVARNLLTLKRAADPPGYPGMFRDLVEMIMTGDAATSARAYLQLLGPYKHKDRTDRRYSLSRYGLERWRELGREAVRETDSSRQRLFREALSEWDVDDAAEVARAVSQSQRDGENRDVWLRLLDTASIWREGPQRTLATWLDAQPSGKRLALACLNLTAKLITAIDGELPVTEELQVAAVRACMRAGSIPRTVPGLSRGEWRVGVARAVADACMDALRADDTDSVPLDAAKANLRSSTAPVITVDSSGAAHADLIGYGNTMWIPVGAQPENIAMYASAELSGERAMALLAAWARDFAAQDRMSASALDVAAHEAALSLLVVLSTREDHVRFWLACEPEVMQPVFSRAVLADSDICAIAGLTLLSRLRWVDLNPVQGPGLIEVLDTALRAGPERYAAALDFLRNVRYVRGASIVRAICEQIEQAPNESVAQGFAGLAAVYLTSPTCATADARRLREALRADIGEKARRRAFHLAGVGTTRSPVIVARGPDRQSEFRRLRRETRAQARVAGPHHGGQAEPPDAGVVAVAGGMEQREEAAAGPAARRDKTKQDGLVQLITDERGGDLIYLVRGKDGGRPAWHYLKVDLLQLTAFKEKLKTGALDVSDYGVILYSGWGQDPPEDIVDRIKGDYS